MSHGSGRDVSWLTGTRNKDDWISRASKRLDHGEIIMYTMNCEFPGHSRIPYVPSLNPRAVLSPRSFPPLVATRWTEAHEAGIYRGSIKSAPWRRKSPCG